MKAIFIAFASATLLLFIGASADATIHKVPGGFATIQSAIVASATVDTIFVGPGTYVENINLLGKQILLRATGRPGEVIIDGNHAGPVVQCVSGERKRTIIDGFKIINGEEALGGGIYCSGSSPTIRNCIITENHGFYHGGIGLFAGSRAQVLNCLIYGNSGANGTIGVDNSSPSIFGCTIVYNVGNGVYCWNASNPVIANNILAFNSFYGVYRHNSANPTLRRNDVYADTAGLYYNMSAGVDDFSADPLFVSPSDDDYRLGASSPCISAALSQYSINNDTYGHSRPLGSWFDVGAIEGYDDGEALSVLRASPNEPERTGSPAEFVVGPNYPNPFNPTTTIEYSLSRESNVTVKVFDIRGAVVATLVSEQQSGGSHRTLWKGTNDSGSPVSSGTYFYLVEVDNIQQIRRMILLK